MPYEVVAQNLTTGEFHTETVKSLGRGRNKIEKGQTKTRSVTVEETWQIIRVTEVEEAPVEEEVAEEAPAEEEITNDDGVKLGHPTPATTV